MPAGPKPAGKLWAAWKVPLPLPSSTLTLLMMPELLDITISGLPSPLRSPTAMGPLIPGSMAKDRGAWRVPSPLPSITVQGEPVIITSSFLSPFKSASATCPPVIGVVLAAVKVPSPLPSSTLTSGYGCGES